MKAFATIVLVIVTLCAGVSYAQSPATGFTARDLEIEGGFTAIRANAAPGDCGCFYMYGGNAQVSMATHKGLSILLDYGRTSARNINGEDHNLTLSSYMGGVRYTPSLEKRWSPYGQVLVGSAHTSSNYAIDADVYRFAAAVGGGVNIGLSKRFDLRLAEVQYLLTRIPNSVNEIQNQLRLSTGVVYHLGKY